MRKVHCACKIVLLQEARGPVFPSISGDTAPFYNYSDSLTEQYPTWFQFCSSSALRRNLIIVSNGHGLPISLAAIHCLASLLDRGQHGIVRDTGFGGNVRGLGFEVDIEGFDACNAWV